MTVDTKVEIMNLMIARAEENGFDNIERWKAVNLFEDILIQKRGVRVWYDPTYLLFNAEFMSSLFGKEDQTWAIDCKSTVEPEEEFSTYAFRLYTGPKYKYVQQQLVLMTEDEMFEYLGASEWITK